MVEISHNHFCRFDRTTSIKNGLVSFQVSTQIPVIHVTRAEHHPIITNMDFAV